MDEMLQILNRNINYAGELKMSKEMTDAFIRWLKSEKVVKECAEQEVKILKEYIEAIKQKFGVIHEASK